MLVQLVKNTLKTCKVVDWIGMVDFGQVPPEHLLHLGAVAIRKKLKFN